MEDEGAAVGDLDQLGQILLGLLRIDVGGRVVAKDAKEAVDAKVDGRRLDAAVEQRVDDDRAVVERLADRAVGEDHAGGSLHTRSIRGSSQARLESGR